MHIMVNGASTDTFFEFDDAIRFKRFRDIYNGSNPYFVKREWYAELTGIYELAHMPYQHIVGFEQYRRYFTDPTTHKPLGEVAIRNILETNDIICGYDRYPYSEVSGDKLWHWPLRHGKIADFALFIDTLRESVSTQFAQYCVDYMSGNHLCHGNMFICKAEVLQKYYDYLFNHALPAFDNVCKFTKDNYRICGHIAEFLFGAWLEFNKYKIYYNNYYCADLGIIDNEGYKLHINATNDNLFDQRKA